MNQDAIPSPALVASERQGLLNHYQSVMEELHWLKMNWKSQMSELEFWSARMDLCAELSRTERKLTQLPTV